MWSKRNCHQSSSSLCSSAPEACLGSDKEVVSAIFISYSVFSYWYICSLYSSLPVEVSVILKISVIIFFTLLLHCHTTYTIYIKDELVHICRPFSESYSESEGSKKGLCVCWNGFQWEVMLMTIDSSAGTRTSTRAGTRYQHPFEWEVTPMSIGSTRTSTQR